MGDESLNDTLQGIRETLRLTSLSNAQQSAVSINFLKVPEFSGKPDEDVSEFLKKYKVATSMLTDEQKCLSLTRALIGSAAIWSKTIKSLCSEGKWKEVQKALKDRFGPADRNIRLREKLAKMSYMPSTHTLQSYVEAYEDLYKKAFNEQGGADIIQALRVNLPDRVIRGLNYLDDSWSSYKGMEDFYKLIKRYEANIQPYEKNEDNLSKQLDRPASGTR